MQADFWHQCWQENKLGFQLDNPHPLLVQHLSNVLQSTEPLYQQIFLPLCGKSPDLFFCQQFLPVQGVELSAIACEAFFTEHELSFQHSQYKFAEDSVYNRFSHERICLWQGDFFALPNDFVQADTLIYDRAALIALPPRMRVDYANKLLAWLQLGAGLLLITLEYPEHEKVGPPFSVSEDELQTLLPGMKVKLLQSSDLTGQGFAKRRFATSSLVEKIYYICK